MTTEGRFSVVFTDTRLPEGSVLFPPPQTMFSSGEASEFLKDHLSKGSTLTAYVIREDGSVMWRVFWSADSNEIRWESVEKSKTNVH